MAKKTLKAAVCAVLAILLAVGLCGCKIVVDGVDVTDYTSAQYTTYDFFNTYCTVACYLPQDKKDDLDKLWKGEITSALERVEGLLSQDGENSDVRAYNEATAGETLEIDEITYDALSLAGQAYRDTEGAFNPALALSVDLWGFSPRFNEGTYSPEKPYDRQDHKKELPDNEYVEAFRTLADFSTVEIYEKDAKFYVVKSDLSVEVGNQTYTQQLDLSGIGKGYCADMIAEILRENGFSFGYVSIGGSSMAMLKNARKESGADLGAWTVSVLSPTQSGEYYFKAYVKDKSLATSGGYQQYYEIDGIRYSHILDASTGKPYDSDVLTASVYGESAALCDAYSTAFCVLGSKDALKLAEKLDGYTYTLAVKTEGGFSVKTNASGKTL